MLLNFNTKIFDTENTADADYDVAWGDNMRDGGWESETCEPEKLLLFTSTPRKVQQWVVMDHNRCNERNEIIIWAQICGVAVIAFTNLQSSIGPLSK